MGEREVSAATLQTLLLYDALFEQGPGAALKQLLIYIEAKDPACLAAYRRWFQAIAATGLSWGDYLLQALLTADNPFTVQSQGTTPLPAPLLAAARADLRQLQQLYYLDTAALSRAVQSLCCLEVPPTAWTLPSTAAGATLPERSDWGAALNDLIAHYRCYGVGLLARHRAYRWQGQLQGIDQFDPICLEDLAAYDGPRQRLIENTEYFLAGHRALHVLLYGSRGSGKSSLVKALVNQYWPQGLRLVEVPKAQLQELGAIATQLRSAPHKFIIFVDDLSFEEDDETFKALKVVLEGSATARPQNLVVYATSNRRHLVREYFSERPRPSDQDEIQAWDTLQEKLSFCDRFGLTLTFEPADQPTYLTIVHHLAAQVGLTLAEADLTAQALQWATRHNGRSGRTARQFIDFLSAQQASQ